MSKSVNAASSSGVSLPALRLVSSSTRALANAFLVAVSTEELSVVPVVMLFRALMMFVGFESLTIISIAVAVGLTGLPVALGIVVALIISCCTFDNIGDLAAISSKAAYSAASSGVNVPAMRRFSSSTRALANAFCVFASTVFPAPANMFLSAAMTVVEFGSLIMSVIAGTVGFVVAVVVPGVGGVVGVATAGLPVTAGMMFLVMLAF